jgi:A/G-specific adenine glycosylase
MPKTTNSVKKNGTGLRGKGFGRLLLKWDRESNRREMPWKGEKDPYRIWISEIILQQTRVERGWNYYNRFMSLFPNIEALAQAKEEEVFKTWEGLGYYSRCRNLVSTARYISNELNGRFPQNYEEILQLKGVGPYTAAAIASFAYNQPHAVVDGNVYRVLSRVFGIRKKTNNSSGKAFFNKLANELLDREQASIYNQAIMDFGAQVCKPVPVCKECIFRKNCIAYKRNLVMELPVREKKKATRKRWFYFLVMTYRNKIAIRRRVDRDIWQGLYEFPLVESTRELEIMSVLRQAGKNKTVSKTQIGNVRVSEKFKQQLSHQQIHSRFLECKMLERVNGDKSKDLLWIGRKETSRYSFPRVIREYVDRYIG